MSDPESEEEASVPQLALDIINDALEYHSHAIVHGPVQDVEAHWSSLTYFWRLSVRNQPHCGRIFHRCRIAEPLGSA